MKKNILIISLGPIHSDPRIIRQIEALKKDYTITTAGYTASKDELVTSIVFEQQKYKPIDFYYNYPFILKKIISLFFGIYFKLQRIWREISHQIKANYLPITLFAPTIYANKINAKQYDLIIANDIFALPLAVLSKKKYPTTKIYFDAHEYHAEEREHDAEWKHKEKPIVEQLFKKCIKYVDSMSSVSKPIVLRYKNELSIPVEVITNASFYYNLTPSSSTKKISLVHHGRASKDRMLEVTFDCINYLDPEQYDLHVILTPDKDGYIEELKRKYSSHKNMYWHQPVETTQIPNFINQFDIGIYILPPLNFNNENALPNKFFEFIQARLALVTGPSPAMKEIIEEYQIGTVTSEYSALALAESIKKISKTQLEDYKNNTTIAAKELSAENNLIKINALVSSLILN